MICTMWRIVLGSNTRILENIKKPKNRQHLTHIELLVLNQSQKSEQSQILTVNLLYLFTLSTSFMVRNQTGIHLCSCTFENECPIHKTNPTGRTDFATKF